MNAKEIKNLEEKIINRLITRDSEELTDGGSNPTLMVKSGDFKIEINCYNRSGECFYNSKGKLEKFSILSVTTLDNFEVVGFYYSRKLNSKKIKNKIKEVFEQHIDKLHEKTRAERETKARKIKELRAQL